MSADKTIYKDDSIQSLSPREHVQLRPGMYVGNTDTPWGLLKELIDNSIDEYSIGHVKTITIDISDSDEITYSDDGQGIPANVMRDDGKTVLEAAVSVINTSGKFTDDGVYSGISVGLHGVGEKTVNFLSDFFEITTYNKGGKCESLRFENGLLKSRSSDGNTGKRKHGVYVRFKPGSQYFDSTTIDRDKIEEYVDCLCCLAPGLEIFLNGINRKDNLKIIPNGKDDGIATLVKKMSGSNSPLSSTLVVSDKSLYLGLMYTDSSSSVIDGYVNYGHTESGPHYVAVKGCITKALNKWAKDNGLLKKGTLDGASLQEGLVCAFNLMAKGIKYDSQSKERVTSSDFVPDINAVLGSALERWLNDNPTEAKAILEKAILAKKASEAAKKAREAVKEKAKKKSEKLFNLPTKLADCHSRDRKKCEIFVTEGK